eukprot:m.76102 g.76102  ORF g.76102 m.76102 type:complete len:209 (-) comp24859_c1_seq1:303-929(-)
MGSSQSYLTDEAVTQLSQEYGFSGNNVRMLFRRFTTLDKAGYGFLRAEDFMQVPELSMNPLMARIIAVFGRQLKREEEADENGTEKKVYFHDFVSTLSVFQDPESVGKWEEHNDEKAMKKIEVDFRARKEQFVFDIYDIDGNGFIDQKELFQVLTMMVGDNLDEKQLSGIVEQTFGQVKSKDPKGISRKEFTEILSHMDITSRMTIPF